MQGLRLTRKMSFSARVPVGAIADETFIGVNNLTAQRHRLETLYQQYAGRVFTLAIHFSGDPDAAKDITQSVFLKVFRGIDTFRNEAEVGTWIHRITYNACMDHRRRGRFRFLWLNVDDVDVAAPEAESPDALVERQQIQRRVRRALAGLPPKYRMPLLLKFLEDMTYPEIAEVMQCRVGTVSSRISRGQRLLAKQLARTQVESEGTTK